jgi:polysaccharide export outer membrane protein
LKKTAGEVMKLRMIAVCLLLLGASAVVPFRVSGEMTGGSAEKSGIEMTLPPEDEPAEPVTGEHPAATAEPVPEKETVIPPAEAPQAAPAPPLADSATRKETEVSQSAAPQAAPAPLAADNSWWKNIMRKLGFGADPNSGETVQSAAPQAVPALPAADKPWLKNIMYKLGLGADPNPGETVQSATSGIGVDADYIIGPGDQIGISVWRDENLTRTVVVLPDGKINFPLIGEVVAGGKTVSQLKQELEKRLARYVSDTGMTVEVKQSNSMIIFVIGRVNVPGRQMLLANTNVLQALAMVGGLNPFADKGKIKIFRQEAGKTVVFNFDYDDVSEGRHLETNIDLKRGDVIIVP